MAYTVPTFNILYNLYDIGGFDPVGPTWDWDTLAPIAMDQPGQLRFSAGRVPYMSYFMGWNTLSQGVLLLVPARTDLRDPICNLAFIQIVEVPAGTERFYMVLGVEDVARGFINEYRAASITKTGAASPWIVNGVNWPSPIG